MILKNRKLKKALQAYDVAKAKECVADGAELSDLFIQEFLLNAISNADLDAIKTYVESGLDIEQTITKEKGKSILYWAGEQDRYGIVKYLASKGAKLDVYANDGTSILYEVASNCYFSTAVMIGFFVEGGVPIDYQGNPNGETALMKSAMNNRMAITRVLIKLNADLTLTNENGYRAWDCASQNLKHLFPEHKIEQEKQKRKEDFLDKRNKKRQERRQQETEDREEAGRGTWSKCFNDSVVCVQISEEINTELKEIFNFEAREITSIFRNLETDAESNSSKSFAEYTDKKQLFKACIEYNKLETTKTAVNPDEIINIKIKMINGLKTNKTKIAIMG